MPAAVRCIAIMYCTFTVSGLSRHSTYRPPTKHKYWWIYILYPQERVAVWRCAMLFVLTVYSALEKGGVENTCRTVNGGRTSSNIISQRTRDLIVSMLI